MTLRVHCSSHTHYLCFLSLTQETEPARMTNSRSNENGQDNILATQCAAVAEQPATEVATTTDAARDTPIVAPPSIAPPNPLDFDAFRTGVHGDTRNEEAARRSKTRAVDTIVNAIVSVGTSEQQSLALYKALLHPTINEVAKSASFGPDQACWHLQRDNVIKIIEDANKGQAKGGRSNNVKSAFVKSLMVALASTPERVKQNDPSLRKQAKLLGLKVSTGWRYLSEGSKKRRMIENGEEYYPTTKKARRKSRYDAAYKESIKQWVTNHQFVRVSPIRSDMLQIGDRREPKLLREIPIREMHNDLLRSEEECGLKCARDDNGQPTISDTRFRSLVKEVLPQLRKATARHKQMCGCETCIGSRYLQAALNRFRASNVAKRLKEIAILKETVSQEARTRSRENEQDNIQKAEDDLATYQEFVLPNGEPLHPKPKDALDAIMCAPILNGIRKWECVLGRCAECSKYPTPAFESTTDENDVFAKIPFRHYKNFTKCTIHKVLDDKAKQCDACEEQYELNNLYKKGKIRRRKELTRSEETIGHFMEEYYLPLLEKYRFHQPHVHLLSKYGVGAGRHAAFHRLLHALFMKRDFAEAIQAEMDNEVQGDHFGKIRKMMLEGCSVEYLSAELEKFTKEFHSHLSDDCKQNAATSFENMRNVLKGLSERGILKENVSVVFDNTDGCCSQYRCATGVYLLSMLATMFKISIDRQVHAPGHGKDEVDGLNATTKRFLCEKMSTTHKEDGRDNSNRMADWAMEGGAEKCLSSEAVRLLENPDRKDGVTCAGKHKKRFDNRAVTERHYHVLKAADVKFDDLKMETLKFKKVSKGKHNGLGSRYNIRTDPDLGVGFAAIRRIPCACDDCCDQLKKTWVPGTPPNQQPRYEQSKQCELWPVFEGHNDWEIVEIKPGENTGDDTMEDVYATVLESIADVMASEIEQGKIGAVSTVDETYYLLQWTSLPYRIEGDQFLTEYDPPIHVKDGELVCEGKYLEELLRAKGWYYPTAIRTVVRLQQVLAADIKLSRITAPDNLLPRSGWPQREPPFEKLGKRPERVRQLQLAEQSTKICQNDHDEVLEEMRRRQLLDYDEEEETDNEQEEDDVSTSDVNNDSESDNDTSDDDT
jgi:hypothetical protein